MAVDFAELATFNDGLESTGNLMFQKNLKPETDIRVLPPGPGMSFYFCKEILYWINGQRYVSPKTFGEWCPIEHEVNEAQKLRDPYINQLLADSKSFMMKEEYSMPILELICQYSQGEVIDVRPVGGPKIFKCTRQLLKAINKIALGNKYQNGTDNGFCDLTYGFNITLYKETVNGKVTYDAEAHRYASAIPPEWVTDMPDVVANIEGQLKSNEELTAAIRGYLYGGAVRQSQSVQQGNVQRRGTQQGPQQPQQGYNPNYGPQPAGYPQSLPYPDAPGYVTPPPVPGPPAWGQQPQQPYQPTAPAYPPNSAPSTAPQPPATPQWSTPPQNTAQAPAQQPQHQPQPQYPPVQPAQQAPQVVDNGPAAAPAPPNQGRGMTLADRLNNG